MDYEKLYKEALERAREYHKVDEDNTLRLYARGTMEYLFPELKESKDVWIKKEIINYLKEKGDFRSCWIAWLEKQGEQRPTDTVESKFKIGDWIVNVNDGDILHINKVLEYAYEVTNLKGGVYESSRCSTETCYKLWTIQDAKDGDVLVTVDDKRPFIYKGCLDLNHTDSPVAYFGIGTGEYFCKGGDNFDHWWTDMKVQPATKEQRDILFQKMHEAGYGWDVEKKELKEIEQKPTQKVESFEAEHGKYYYCIKDYFYGGKKQASKGDVIQALRGLPIMGLKDASEYFLPANLIKCNSSWSEEDEKQLNTIVNVIHGGTHLAYEKELNWLKSLKERYTWKPSKEQMTQLKRYCPDNRPLTSLYEQLKKIRYDSLFSSEHLEAE